ncbi:sensor domain-containing diguanylate cyclase [Cohnella terricola]|uniref:Diguanylate cyclase n=1 Tax=Cohnella terricola TaxID=1289167 RepID=A0A559JTQ7_9BACL|nr:sensor domain-containing diguanylate cyclase [Cohnella terricola]TVY03261.1 diguanylate cyclase [Cohnella terricola]
MDDKLNDLPCGFFTLTNAGVITEANRTLLNLLQYESGDMLHHHIEAFLTVANKIFFHTYFYPYIQLHGHVNEIYLTLKKKDGHEVPVLLNGVLRERDDQVYIECVLIEMRKRIEYEKDIVNAAKKLEELNKEKDAAHEALKALHKELEKKQEELTDLNRTLELQALTDGLTGVSNRRAFQECLDAAFAAFARSRNPFAMVLLDIDYFKRINDTYGHPVGDEILRRLTQELQAQIRSIDVLARYGGEEFAIILPGANRESAVIAAERFRKSIEEADWGEYRVTISLGAATVSEEDTAESLIAKADQALYASKSGGRNRVTHSED